MEVTQCQCARACMYICDHGNGPEGGIGMEYFDQLEYPPSFQNTLEHGRWINDLARVFPFLYTPRTLSHITTVSRFLRLSAYPLFLC